MWADVKSGFLDFGEKLSLLVKVGIWIPAPRSESRTSFAGMTRGAKYRTLFMKGYLIFYQLYNRIEVVRCLYGRIAELALFFFVVVDRYVGVF